MFDRFTVLARQSLFCARYKAEERHGNNISTQDLLGGLMMAAPEGVLRFASQDAEILRPAVTREQMWRRMRDELVAGGMTAGMGREIPFSSSLKLTFERSVQEANDLRHKFIRPEHLLLGLLREEDTDEWRTLQKVGVTLREVRRVLSGEPDLVSGEDATGQFLADEP
jgi:ATP-dependent Clp protease ATP-binding subunit ClpC